MRQPTLTQCSCATNGGRCDDDCTCCDSPYAIGHCTCDCLARKLAAIFDAALAEDAPAYVLREPAQDDVWGWPSDSIMQDNGPVSALKCETVLTAYTNMLMFNVPTPSIIDVIGGAP